MGDWLYKIGLYKVLYWIGRGICSSCRVIYRFGTTLKWIWLGRGIQEVIRETLKDLPQGYFDLGRNKND